MPLKIKPAKGLPEPNPLAQWSARYRFKTSNIDLSFVSESDVIRCAELLTGALLGEGEGQYSVSQVRRALWEFYKQEESRLLDQLAARFLDWSDTSRRRDWLGEPEIAKDPE